MKNTPLTVRLDPRLEAMLERVCRDTGRSRSEVVREALRRQLTLELVEEARRQLVPFEASVPIFSSSCFRSTSWWLPLHLDGPCGVVDSGRRA